MDPWYDRSREAWKMLAGEEDVKMIAANVQRAGCERVGREDAS